MKKTKSKKQSTSKLTRVFNNKKLPLFVVAIVFALIGAWFIRGSFAATSWTLYWADEFNGTAVNTADWGVYYNTYGEGNKEEACLTPNNVSVSGGSLKIVAQRQAVNCNGDPAKAKSFTSGFISSRSVGSTGSSATASGKYYPSFAKYEMRAKVPHGQGLWPALWLRHKDGAALAEVDIMEYFHAQVPGKATGTLHYANVSNVTKKTVAFETPTATPGWHVWSVEMEDTPSGVLVKWLLDGNAYHQYTVADKSQFTKYQDGFDIAINMAVGGTYSGHPDDPLGYSRYLQKCLKPYGGAAPCDASGISRAQFPATYEIDYVRVYTKSTVPETPPTQVKLGVPTGLKATPDNSTVTLEWDAVEGADNYTVRWGTGGSWTNYSNGTGLTNPTTNKYVVTGLQNGTLYNFSVAARDKTGVYLGSDYSGSITATPVNPVISAPQNVKVTASNRSFTAQWSASTDPRVDQYSLRYTRSDSKTKSDGATWTYPGRTSSTKQYVSGLRNGVTYDVQVRAIDNKGTADTADDSYSVYSTTVTARPR
jgi:Glycosyl hydrolases family 16/Fibronectin type III domain